MFTRRVRVTDESGAIADTDRSRGARDRDTALVLGFIGVMVVVYAALSITGYFTFDNAGFDTAIFGNTLWRLAHGLSDQSAMTGAHQFADHISLILFLFVPFFRIGIDAGFAALYMGLAVSTGLVALAVWRLGILERLDGRLLRLLVVVTLVAPPAVLVTRTAFHATSLGLGPLAMTLAEGSRPRPSRYWWIWPVLAAACRQELAAAVVIAGLLLWKRNRQAAILTSIIGGVMLVASLVWILLSPLEGVSAGYSFSHLGDTPSGIALGTLRNPGAVLGPLFDTDVVLNLAGWLLPFGLIASLRAWPWLLVALPLVMIPVLSNKPIFNAYWEHYWHILLVAGSISAVIGLARLNAWWTHVYPAILVSFSALMWIVWFSDVSHIVAVSTDPASQAVYEQLVDEPEVSLSTTSATVVRLSDRETVMMFPRPFVCVRRTFGFFESPPEPPSVVVVDERLEDGVAGPGWDAMMELLESAYEPQVIDDDITIWRMADPATAASLYTPCDLEGDAG